MKLGTIYSYQIFYRNDHLGFIF